jgi:uncharacterized membrane protein YvbJ
MALIICPECNKQISDQAQACPGCGMPVKTIRSLNSMSLNTEQVIELTAKRYKIIKLISIFMIIVSIFSCLFEAQAGSDSMFGMVIFFIGLGLYIFNRFQIWWHHK